MQRALIVGGLAVVALVFDRQIGASIDVPKSVLVGVLALVLLGTELWAVGRAPAGSRTASRAPRPARLAVVTGGALLTGMTLSTLFSPDVRVSLFGAYPRSAGLMFYASMLVIGWVTSRAFDPPSSSTIPLVLTPTLLVISGYALVQGLGLDPLPWETFTFGGAFATLGNPNVLSSFVGVTVPLAVVVLLGGPVWARLVAVAALLLAVPATYYSESVQGPIGLVAGLAVTGGLLLHRARRSRADAPVARRLPAWTPAAVVVLGVGGLAATLLAFPDLVAQGLVERRYFYDAAWDLFLSNPVLGAGIGTFGLVFSTVRPIGHAQLVGPGTADSVHSVPLSMLAEGGAVVLLAYLLFVAAVAWVIVTLVRGGGTTPLVAGLAGSWVAFHVQSLVSVESTPLTLIHLVVAGVLVAHLRAAPPEPADGGKVPLSQRLEIPATARRVGLQVLAVALPLLLLAPVTAPWRAERAISDAAAASRAGDLLAAVTAFERAHELRPEVGAYYLLHSRVLRDASRPAEALTVLRRGVEADRGNLAVAATAGQVAAEVGETAEASALYDTALARDPFNPIALRAVAQHFLGIGEPARAIELYERALEVEPDAEDLPRLLDEAREVLQARAEGPGDDDAGTDGDPPTGDGDPADPADAGAPEDG